MTVSIFFCIYIIVLIILIFFAIWALYKQYKQQQQQDSPYILYIITITFYISIIIFSVSIITENFIQCTLIGKIDAFQQIISALNLIPYGIQYFLVLIVLFLRLYFSFKGSVYINYLNIQYIYLSLLWDLSQFY